jgi:5'-nucleotidase
MPTILITNDDGVYSPGLLALAHGLAPLGDIVILAPERNWSASSHSITMHKPLRVNPVVLADGTKARSSSGGPSDCVALAAGGVVGIVPDIVVSGINAGYNLGVDVTYSGTVACAIEATIKGIPGIAVSTINPAKSRADITAVHKLAAAIACDLAAQVLERGLPPQTLLNVNVPDLLPPDMKGIRVTRMGGRTYKREEIVERADPWGRPYYWLGGSGPVDGDSDGRYDGSEVDAITNGYASVTPVALDMTNYSFLSELSGWQLREPTEYAVA